MLHVSISVYWCILWSHLLIHDWMKMNTKKWIVLIEAFDSRPFIYFPSMIPPLSLPLLFLFTTPRFMLKLNRWTRSGSWILFCSSCLGVYVPRWVPSWLLNKHFNSAEDQRSRDLMGCGCGAGGELDRYAEFRAGSLLQSYLLCIHIYKLKQRFKLKTCLTAAQDRKGTIKLGGVESQIFQTSS